MTYKIVRVTRLQEASIPNGKIVEVVERGLFAGSTYADILVEIDDTKENKEDE